MNFTSESAFEDFLAKIKDPYAYKSKRHHYIPRFYLEGFTNDKGLLYVYDKKTEKIEQKPPKSVFFEWDRNSIANKQGEKISLLEDSFYGTIDNLFAPVLSKIRDTPNDGEAMTLENVALMKYFITDLFWRVPKLDETFNEMHQRSSIKLFDKDGNEVTDDDLVKKILADKEMQKAYRAGVSTESVNRAIQNRNTGTTTNRLVELERNLLITGDFPIVYKKTPSLLEDVMDNELFIPISSNRVFFTASKCDLYLATNSVLAINTVIIEQSMRYICGPDKDFLSKSIQYHSMMKKEGIIPLLQYRLFTGK